MISPYPADQGAAIEESIEEETSNSRQEHRNNPFVPSAFIALSKFTVANDMSPQVKQAFIDRPHLVDSAPGFIRMEVISPIDAPDEIWLLTYWSNESSYRAWHKSHTYRDSHAGIPKGLRLDPRETAIRFFEHICS